VIPVTEKRSARKYREALTSDNVIPAEVLREKRIKKLAKEIWREGIEGGGVLPFHKVLEMALAEMRLKQHKEDKIS